MTRESGSFRRMLCSNISINGNNLISRMLDGKCQERVIAVDKLFSILYYFYSTILGERQCFLPQKVSLSIIIPYKTLTSAKLAIFPTSVSSKEAWDDNYDVFKHLNETLIPKDTKFWNPNFSKRLPISEIQPN